jgi:dihydrodipicolinate synthase/N-acetylneuraminate lyase
MHVDLYEAFLKGDLNKARNLYDKLAMLFRFGANPVGVKSSLNALGLKVGLPRKPLAPLSGEELEKLKSVLATLDLAPTVTHL